MKIVLKDEGFFLATFFVEKTNYTEPEWVYPNCVTYKHSYISQMANEENLAVAKTKWHHPNGQTWYVFFHPENSASVNQVLSNLFSTNRQKFSPIKFIKKQNSSIIR